MSAIKEHLFLIDNAVIWAIVLVAFFCYGLLFDLCMSQKHQQWYERTLYWSNSLKQLLSALPLLGLLGTISGLLKTFTEMASSAGLNMQELITGGIGEAMFTTQLGLLMVIPGTLMLAYLNHRKAKWAMDQSQ